MNDEQTIKKIVDIVNKEPETTYEVDGKWLKCGCKHRLLKKIEDKIGKPDETPSPKK